MMMAYFFSYCLYEYIHTYHAEVQDERKGKEKDWLKCLVWDR
jgi:hypothetical protein